MSRLLCLSVLFTSFAAFDVGETFSNIPVVDVACSKNAAANPDAHTRACGLQCQKSGFGIVTGEHKFLKFDSQGNTLFIHALKNSNKIDHLRVDVTGDVQGDTIKVTSLKLL